MGVRSKVPGSGFRVPSSGLKEKKKKRKEEEEKEGSRITRMGEWDE